MSEHTTDCLAGVKNIVLVLSGKGGVGKSTVTSQLALALLTLGKRVGILDVDICGPSIPKIFGVQKASVMQCSAGWVPVFPEPPALHASDPDSTPRFAWHPKQLAIMSIAFLLPSENDAVVWRGPKKTVMIKQFMQEVFWENLDYLLIDTPPGTSDEHLSTIEYLKASNPRGAILVTTPQQVSITDVRKEASFCHKMGIKVLGVVENMSGFVCPCCGEVDNVFLTGGGEKLAAEISSPFLGCIPIDPLLGNTQDDGCRDFVPAFLDSKAVAAVRKIAGILDANISCS
eukprot:ANDGO_04827.mRNA.1 Cytosolic Fe-S cluster assembly factor NUBP2 homolog